MREKTLLFGGKKSGLSWKTVNRHCMQWGFFLFGQTQSQKHLYGRTGGKNHESNENKNVGGNGGAVSGSGTDGRMRRRGRCVQLRLGGHILRDGGCGFFRHIIGVGFCECVVGGGQRRGFSRLVRLLRGDGRGVLSPGASGIRGYDSYTGEPSERVASLVFGTDEMLLGLTDAEFIAGLSAWTTAAPIWRPMLRFMRIFPESTKTRRF